MMITDREDLLDLAIDVHDCAGSVRRGVGLPQFAGWNFRASEIQGAVARVQLTRLDGLLERMRANQARLAERVGALPGLTLRRPNDDGGDAGICLVAFAETPRSPPRRSTRCARRASRRCAIYARLRRPPRLSVLEAGARRDRRGREPAPDCPRTLDLLGRSIHVDVSPLCDEQDLDEIALAFEKVAARGARLTVRVGVVGGGLVAQASTSRTSSALRDRFTLAALAEPSATVREALGARYGIPGPARGLPLAARRGRPRRGRRLLAGRDARRGRARRARRRPARLRREADVHHARRRRRDRRRARPGRDASSRSGR